MRAETPEPNLSLGTSRERDQIHVRGGIRILPAGDEDPLSVFDFFVGDIHSTTPLDTLQNV
jgi:hypothetical protein